MATKNLARTVIEGGRDSWSRRTRRLVNGSERTWVRQRLHVLTRDSERDDVVLPHRDTREFRVFFDKLSPAKRWLGSQVGRPWSLVRGELFQKFDTRTTAGRHILFCHVLQEVKEDGSQGRWRFSVDRHGILRRGPYKRKRWDGPFARYLPGRAEIEQWLAGRRVGERGPVLFWFVLTPNERYRQLHRLDDGDSKRWRSLPEWFRQQHDASAPINDNRIDPSMSYGKGERKNDRGC